MGHVIGNREGKRSQECRVSFFKGTNQKKKKSTFLNYEDDLFLILLSVTV